MTNLVTIFGFITGPGRLHGAVTEAVARAGCIDSAVVDLNLDHLPLADPRAAGDCGPTTASVIDRVDRARALVIATPAYRGSYTGALKNCLDLLPIEALCGKPTAIAVAGSSYHDCFGVETQLRQVLGWFGALVLPSAVYLTGDDFDSDKRVLIDGATELDRLLDGLLQTAAALQGVRLGPPPLAARSSA